MLYLKDNYSGFEYEKVQCGEVFIAQLDNQFHYYIKTEDDKGVDLFSGKYRKFAPKALVTPFDAKIDIIDLT